MQLIGLTGPSGAGKSRIAEQFAQFGLPVLDADKIYHELLAPPSECLDELARHFGTEILSTDGTLNRPLLAARVFGNAEALKELNAIAHRHVMQEVRNRLRAMQESGIRAAVFDAPQLFESGADKECVAVVAVVADEDVRLQRILARDGITREEALRRFRAQKSNRFFREHADYVIENNNHCEDTAEQIKIILASLEARL